MATKNSILIAFSDSLGSINLSYHPNFAFNTYNLYWNSGNGYRNTYCLNAKGNQEFYSRSSSYHSSDWSNRDFYIGNGAPDENSYLSGMLASALVGTKIGCVDPGANKTTFANLATIGRNLYGVVTKRNRKQQFLGKRWRRFAYQGIKRIVDICKGLLRQDSIYGLYHVVEHICFDEEQQYVSWNMARRDETDILFIL